MLHKERKEDMKQVQDRKSVLPHKQHTEATSGEKHVNVLYCYNTTTY